MAYILYPILFNAVQTLKGRIKFYVRTLKHDKRAVHNFHLSKQSCCTEYHHCSLKKKKVFLFVNTDVRSLFNERTLLPRQEEVKDLAFLKLYLLNHVI